MPRHIWADMCTELLCQLCDMFSVSPLCSALFMCVFFLLGCPLFSIITWSTWVENQKTLAELQLMADKRPEDGFWIFTIIFVLFGCELRPYSLSHLLHVKPRPLIMWSWFDGCQYLFTEFKRMMSYLLKTLHVILFNQAKSTKRVLILAMWSTTMLGNDN